ncbi:hypothetical protein HJC99_04905 [Candidatus Saccharibacteria bacterium]|nr:hypothetical protein [Candidatus Saccharibacteria bacterium]
MNTEPPIIISSGVPPAAPQRSSHLSLILIIVLGIGTLGFGLASVVAVGKAHSATASLASAKQAAAESAANTQKEADDKAAILANESPFRTYTAPAAFGSFAISFPKNWMISADLEDNSTTQVTLVLQPDILRTSNGVDDLYATEILLIRQQTADYTTKLLASKMLTEKDVTVAGISAMQFTGTFNDPRTKTLIAVPVRDKTMVFVNEDPAYATEYQAILAQAKINP